MLRESSLRDLVSAFLFSLIIVFYLLDSVIAAPPSKVRVYPRQDEDADWRTSSLRPLYTTTKFETAQPIPTRSSSWLNAIVDTSTIPKCAVANCVTSKSWLPAKLGCSTTELTNDCFCNVAVAPLVCSPHPPHVRLDKPCFYELQTWFNGICGASVKRLDSFALPDCGHNCADLVLGDRGCSDMSLNCACQLEEEDFRDATTECLVDKCGQSGGLSIWDYKQIEPAKFVENWYDNMCITGKQPRFDIQGYEYWKENKQRDADNDWPTDWATPTPTTQNTGHSGGGGGGSSLNGGEIAAIVLILTIIIGGVAFVLCY